MKKLKKRIKKQKVKMEQNHKQVNDKRKTVNSRASKSKVRRNIYDKIFADLFSNRKYLLELYKVLAIENGGNAQNNENIVSSKADISEQCNNEITEKDIKLLDFKQVLVNDLYNDLSFQVKDELIVLIEAQSTYTKNIATRLLFYTSRAIEEYIRKKSLENNLHDLYQNKVADIPKIKLYCIYTGDNIKEDHYIYLKDLMKNVNIESDIDLKVKVICRADTENVLGQYMAFCSIYRNQIKENKNKLKALENTIKICRNDDILKEYLKNRKHEVRGMIEPLITEEELRHHRYLEGKEEGIAEGIEQGIEKGRAEGVAEGQKETSIEVAKNMLKENVEIKFISRVTNLPVEEIKKIQL